MSLNLIDLKIHSISCILLTNWILQLIYLIKKKKKEKKKRKSKTQTKTKNQPSQKYKKPNPPSGMIIIVYKT